MLAAGDVSAFTAAMKEEVALALAIAAGVPVADVTVTVTAGSVRILADIKTASAADAMAASTSLGTELSTPEAATALLAAASVTITAAPTVAAVVEFLTVFPPPSPYSADDNAGIIVDAACGGAAVVYSSSSPSVLARAGLHAQAPSHVVWCYGACTARQHARVRTRCKV